LSLGFPALRINSLLLGGFSGRFRGYGYGYGHGGMSLIGVILVSVLILVLLGRI
jgi:hypothetical protein